VKSSLTRFCGALRGVVTILSALSRAFEELGRRRPRPLTPSARPSLRPLLLTTGGALSLVLGVAASTGAPLGFDPDLMPTTLPSKTARSASTARATTTPSAPTPAPPTTTSGTTTSTPPPPPEPDVAPGPFFFRGDFESGDFSQWPHLHDLGPRFRPDQSLSSVVSRPGGGKMAKFVVSESLPRGNSDSGPMSMVAHKVSNAWEQEGAETWYRVRILLPSGSNPDYPGTFHPLQPAPSGWNTFVSWHEYRVGGMSPSLGRSTWCRHRAGCFQVKWVGGRGKTYWVDDEAEPLRFDHWYDVLVHVKWSAYEDKGYAEVWVDGRKIFGPGIGGVPSTIATLWRHEDGQPAATYLTLGHYRRHPRLSGIADYGDDTVYADDLLIGPTRAAVGG
jgi:Polysaccharide lyase